MVDWKDLAKETASKVGDLAGAAGEKLVEAGKAGAEKGAEWAKVGAVKGAELAKEGAEKGFNVTKLAGSEAWQKGQELFSSLRTEEDSEAQKLQQEQKTLADLPPDEQDKYLEALLYLLVPFDPPDLTQLRRIYQILAMMELGIERRSAFLERLFYSTDPPGTGSVAPNDEMLRFSLGKDLLALSGTADSEQTQARGALLLKGLELTEDQINVLSQWTNWENKILAKIGRSDLTVDSKDLPVEAMKKASAVGVPLAALYVSGSVVGFSAVGITSGLATIGGAAGLTALGLNPMTAGIAALILGGVAVKKILDATLPTTKADQDKKLQAGLRIMEARRNCYLAMLSQDLVRLTKEGTGKVPAELDRRRQQAVAVLGALLENEAELTLGPQNPPQLETTRE